jgi:FKBP-type peptidyl-prolyl cis-trans isomerase 2
MNKAIVWVALSVAVLWLVGCGSKKTDTPTDQPVNNPVEEVVSDGIAKIGDTIKVDYVGTLDDGSMFDTSIVAKAQEGKIFDESRPYEPLTVNLGKNEVIPGFEKALEGMKKWETKKITLTADEAYGQPRPELTQKVPADTFSGSDIKPEVGKTYNFGIAQGTVKEITDTEITIDFNHPLAGKSLTFELTVVDIIPWWAAQAQPTADVALPEAPAAEPTAEEAVMPEAEQPAADEAMPQ